MFKAIEDGNKCGEVMLGKASLSKCHVLLSEGLVGVILHSFFWNDLLRFIVINGERYPTNSKLHLREGIFLAHTNPHEEDIRVSYDENRKVLFLETKKMVPHPFIGMQRINSNDNIIIEMEGYEAAGYTNPDKKVPKWNKVGEEIPINAIASLRIRSFWDRPSAIWNNKTDYTAYEIIIKTKGNDFNGQHPQ